MPPHKYVSGSKETKTIGLEDEAKQNEKKRRSQENITLEDGKEELKRNKDSTNTSFDKDGNDRNFSIKKIGFTCNTPCHLQMIPSVKVVTSHSCLYLSWIFLL